MTKVLLRDTRFTLDLTYFRFLKGLSSIMKPLLHGGLLRQVCMRCAFPSSVIVELLMQHRGGNRTRLLANSVAHTKKEAESFLKHVAKPDDKP